ncbi:GH-E family nuclease [Mycobacterium sp.]|uniref:GH-E family nuclease n=1 Tax=Mycobacterium sp. TaxID=1785 RepID=UPI003BAAC3BC
MGGTDNAGHSWCLKYDALVGGRSGRAGLMEAATASIMGAAQCSDLLAATAVNHQNADQQSAMNNPDAPAFPPTAKPMFLVPAIPSAEGGHGDVPGWWHTIQAYVQGEMWPNGHQDQLRAAADAWHSAAGELRSAADIANDGVIGSVRAQKSPEFPIAATNCTLVRDSLKSIAEGFDAAGKTCSEYAHAIDEAHSQILHEMAELGLTVAVTEIVALVLIPFTVGFSEGASKVVDVARLTATGARIATIIREFRVAAEVSSLPAIGAAGNAARAVAELSPLLAARAQLFLAEGTTPGLLGTEGLDLLSRPYIRAGTRRAAEEAARKTPDGAYYISATDEDVLIPVSKQYEDTILNLPKTPDGKYFMGADGVRYPVDPTYHLGHVEGKEWWRIRDMAIQQHWTRQQLIEYCNRPEFYQVEDAPGNMSHMYELAREAG